VRKYLLFTGKLDF